MLLIRVDASSEIGMGHLLRCMTLAEYFKFKEIEVLFLSQSVNIKSFVSDKGFNFILIPENASLENELRIIEEVNYDYKIDAVLLDINNFHSFKTLNLYKKYLNFLKDFQFVLISFEDPKNCIHTADLIIIPYLDSLKFIPREIYGDKYLLGLDYYILRSEFVNVKPIKINREVKNILITMGGSDPQNMTTKVLTALSELSSLNLTIVLGELFKESVSTIDHILCHFKGGYTVLRNVDNMADVMVNSDIAVINSGLTKYETLAVGLPSIVISNNSYHSELMNDFNALDVLINLGEVDELQNNKLVETVKRLAKDSAKRNKMSVAGKSLIDGHGVKRIFSEIENRIQHNKTNIG